MGYILSAKKVWEGFDFEKAGSTMPNSRDIKNRYQSVDISFDTGCGLEYKFISNLSFIASARYTLGLNNLNKKEFDSSIKVKSTGLQILSGILFYL